MSIRKLLDTVLSLQERAQELKSTEISASSGDRAVTVAITGDRCFQSIQIAPEAIKSGTTAELEGHILAAYAACVEETKRLLNVNTL